MKKLITLLILYSCAAFGQFTTTARHIVHSASLPSTCSPLTGDIYFIQSGGSLGPYYCSATNTWSAITGSPVGAAFSALTGGTNTSAAMVLGNGSSLTFSGTGTNNANLFKGNATVAIADGGTAGTTATAAFNNLAPAATIAGSVIYWNGANWVKLDGNASGTKFLQEDASGVPSWATVSGTGTVTSAAATFTGGIVSIAGSPITTSGTFAFTISGTSGGIPYFNSSTTWATSAALTANLPVIGGGAGTPPTVGTRSGNTTAFVTTTGSQTNGDCVNIDANGNHVAQGAPCLSVGDLAGIYFSWTTSNTVTAVNNTFASSGAEASIELVAAGIPSSINSGGLAYDNNGRFAWMGSTNIQYAISFEGSGVTAPTAPTSGRIPIYGSGFTLTQDSDISFSTDTLTVTKIIGSTSITDSGLTATRMVFAGTGGLLSDDADCTFVTDTLTCTNLVAATSLTVAGAAITNNVVQNSKSAAYTTVLSDAGKHILHPTADNNARTFTIDSNANVAYPIGTVITFVNQINTVTIAITSDTLVLAGPGTTGSRTLAANGIATAMKIATTTWIISGTGLT